MLLTPEIIAELAQAVVNPKPGQAEEWERMAQAVNVFNQAGDVGTLIPNHMLPTYRAVAAHVGSAALGAIKLALAMGQDPAKLTSITSGQLSGLIIGLSIYARVEALQKEREARAQAPRRVHR